VYYLGEISAARAHFEQRIALYEPRQRGSMVHSLSYVAYILWVLVVFGRNNPSPYTVNGRPLYVHLNGLAIVLLK
jgi:hypothetical protein